jgi:integrase
LRRADCDLDNGLIHVRYQLSRARRDKPAERVRLKTQAATRDIPLLPQLAALLKRHKLASPHATDKDYVFATATGKPLSCRNVERRGLGHAADTAELNTSDQPRLRVHDLRHTFASHRILGHARPSITLDTFTHLFHQAAHAADIRQRMATSNFGALIANTDH